ncbi:MAG: M23 family metallopeptidase [Acidimicrobiia bacterium]|nr:M23 family metallopeptidase [Acidimicrobiia bacterium]
MRPAILVMAMALGACQLSSVSQPEVPRAAPPVTSTTLSSSTTTTVAPVVDEVAEPVGYQPPQVLDAHAPLAYPPREPFEQEWTPFATIGDVVLHHPSRLIETIGFHESANDGARQMELLDGAAPWHTMETRDRGNGSRTAADIAAEPFTEIRSPVTGTVLRAGTYVLYCRYSDDFAVIEPDTHPGWEVKILHMENVRVRAGDRVVAGETVIADHPRRLPFSSQVDEATSAPSWPHVHVEVVDPSIPDRPGAGC